MSHRSSSLSSSSQESNQDVPPPVNDKNNLTQDDNEEEADCSSSSCRSSSWNSVDLMTMMTCADVVEAGSNNYDYSEHFQNHQLEIDSYDISAQKLTTRENNQQHQEQSISVVHQDRAVLSLDGSAAVKFGLHQSRTDDVNNSKHNKPEINTTDDDNEELIVSTARPFISSSVPGGMNSTSILDVLKIVSTSGRHHPRSLHTKGENTNQDNGGSVYEGSTLSKVMKEFDDEQTRLDDLTGTICALNCRMMKILDLIERPSSKRTNNEKKEK